MDSIEVVTAENPVESGTPVPEAHDYPQAPCPAEDPVIEAHVHEVDADAPEKPGSEILESPEPQRIARIARRLSSLFRPKSATARVRPHDVCLVPERQPEPGLVLIWGQASVPLTAVWVASSL